MLSLLMSVTVNQGEAIIEYVLVGLSLGLLIKWAFRHFSISLPYTIVLLVVGILLGLVQLIPNNDYSYSESIIASFNPTLILIIFLPALIFDSAYNIHFHVITQTFTSAVLLAGPGVIVSTVLTGVVAKYAFVEYNWSWYAALMFGAILSATDPVSVVALLRDVGAPEKLSTIVEAEALLNDGSGFVLYLVFSELLTRTITDSGSAIGLFFQLSLGGIGFGIVFGWITVRWLNRVFNDSDVEIGSTIVGAYFCFYIAQIYLDVSAVLATVIMGLYVSKYRNCISPDVQSSMHNVWTMIAFLLNTMIFLIAGVIVAEQFINLKISAMDVGYLFLTYVTIHVARVIAVIAFLPLMRRSGHEVTWQEAVVITWAGLRGAVALVLALLVSLNPEIGNVTSEKVVFLVAGNVLLTTVINGSTTGKLISYLQIHKPGVGSELIMQQAIDAMCKRSNDKIGSLRDMQRFNTVDWKAVYSRLPTRLMPMSNNTSVARQSPPRHPSRLSSTTGAYAAAIKGEVSRRLINSMLSDYYEQYSVGMITRDSLNILLAAGEKAAATNSLQIQWQHVSAHFQVPWWLKYMYEKTWLVRVNPLYELINNAVYQHLCVTVELTGAYLTAMKHTKAITNIFPEFDAIDVQLVDQVKQEALKYQRKAFKSWLDLQYSYDTVYTAVQTRHATQSILYYQRKEITQLLNAAVLDNTEYSIIRDDIDSKIYWLERTRFEGRLIPCDMLLQQQYWIQELPTVARAELIDSAYKRFIQHAEQLHSPALHTGGMFIVVRGTVTVTYVDDFDEQDNEVSVHEFADVYRSVHVRTLTDGMTQHVRKEKLSSGSVLGAHDCMTTGITFKAKANTYVEAFFIDRKNVLKLISHSDVPSTIFLIMAEQLLKSRFYTYVYQSHINYLHIKSLVDEAEYVQCNDTAVELRPGQRLLLITGQCQLKRDHAKSPSSLIKSHPINSSAPDASNRAVGDDMQYGKVPHRAASSHDNVVGYPTLKLSDTTPSPAPSAAHTPASSLHDETPLHPAVTDSDEITEFSLGNTVHNYGLRVSPVLVSVDSDESGVTYMMHELCRYILWDSKLEQALRGRAVSKQIGLVEEAQKHGYNVTSWAVHDDSPLNGMVAPSTPVQHSVFGLFNQNGNASSAPETPRTAAQRSANLADMFIPPVVAEDAQEQVHAIQIDTERL